MWIHINNSLVANYTGFVLVRVNLKEDNFLVLQVVYETENSKLIMILRAKVRIFKNKYNVDVINYVKLL